MTWNEITKEEINKILDDYIKIIFDGVDINKLSSYQKRERIYKYLVNNKKYDFEHFDIIQKINKKLMKRSRDTRQEFLDALITDKGVCNGFSSVYKLLLDRVGIYSICVVCSIIHEGEIIGHQLNLVSNDDNTFSFDDVTFGIIKDDTSEYFDYDNPEDKEEKQGYFPICDTKWIMIEDETINYYAKREKSVIDRPKNVNIVNLYFNSLEDYKYSGIYIESKKNKKHQIL